MSASHRRQVRCLIYQSDGTLNVRNARDSQGIIKCRTVDHHEVRCLVADTNRASVRRRSVQRSGSRDNQKSRR